MYINKMTGTYRIAREFARHFYYIHLFPPRTNIPGLQENDFFAQLTAETRHETKKLPI